MTEELDRERVAALAAKIFDNGSAAASGPLEFLAAIEVARTIALVTHRHAVPLDEYRSFLARLAAVEAEFSGRGKELAGEAGKIERGEA